MLEGIVVASQPHGELHRKVLLFSPMGLLDLYVRMPNRPSGDWLALTSLFTRGEYILRESKGSWYRCIDGTVLDLYLGLRRSWDRMEQAHRMVSVLIQTQWKGNPSPSLYQLFSAFLRRVSETDEPLLAPFLIKWMIHEGEWEIDAFSRQEQELIVQTIPIRQFASFPAFPSDLAEKLYSKIIGASVDSICSVKTMGEVSARSFL